MIRDLIGDRYGRLKVIALEERRPSGKSKWLCLCDCGKTKSAIGTSLRNGNLKSCGCLRWKKRTPEAEITRRIKNIWRGMIQRCTNSKSKNWHNYGGRGISVCPAWLAAFRFFLADMREGYREGLTIDRIDVNGDYTKDNCRWTDSLGQGERQRKNVNLEHEGQRQHLAKWARELGVSRQALHARLRSGWSAGDVLSVPIAPRQKRSQAVELR